MECYAIVWLSYSYACIINVAFMFGSTLGNDLVRCSKCQTVFLLKVLLTS